MQEGTMEQTERDIDAKGAAYRGASRWSKIQQRWTHPSLRRV